MKKNELILQVLTQSLPPKYVGPWTGLCQLTNDHKGDILKSNPRSNNEEDIVVEVMPRLSGVCRDYACLSNDERFCRLSRTLDSWDFVRPEIAVLAAIFHWGLSSESMGKTFQWSSMVHFVIGIAAGVSTILTDATLFTIDLALLDYLGP
ncbi:hypothetical protein IW261DRAFT_1428525 [Armillaria novae-zelandiae]|uniref:Uncharacterized protein n=1 Tax=Armillaria novae-zelandiae TaxID=153914 RepID=A0AA39TJP2_9AGAR|nr:hypothetical protein IW261DRAFT_1428525 [Armillaria novae-zelandiae]